jgi:benzoyl-CoA reductase/2-hydroxyglutaryl-CoA dehydratase subunit BcrC/BadD/HgdB
VTALEELGELYQHRDRAARSWRARGGRVVGYLCDNVPQELILAAGFLPYRLSGDPHQGHAAVERWVQPFAAPFSAGTRGLDFIDSMLDMVLAGRYDFLDYLIVPHTRKAIQAMYRELVLATQQQAELTLPELWYLDRAYTPFYAAEVFNREQLLAFKGQLETWSGQSISPEALSAAVAMVDDNRRLARQVLSWRTADSPRLSGVEALAVLGPSHWMPPGEHSALLRRLLDEPPPPRPVLPRLFMGGSPLDHPQVYELIESCGATIVDEDHCWGSRCADARVDSTLEPFETLAKRYHCTSACSIEFPLDAVIQGTVARAARAGVDGAIFFVYGGDGVHVWDTPDELLAMQRQGIPTLHLSRQPYWIADSDAFRQQVQPFISSLRRGAAIGQ